MKIKTNRKGFTIVELVIVIAVIGILSAVLIPTFSGLIGKANQQALQTNLRNAYTQYAEQNADQGDIYAQNEILLSKDGETVYTFDVEQNKWVVDELAEGNEYVAEDATEYNGYKVYKEQLAS